MSIDFAVGFIVRLEEVEKGGKRVPESKGLKISEDRYDTVYRDLDYITRLKIKQTLDNFLAN